MYFINNTTTKIKTKEQKYPVPSKYILVGTKALQGITVCACRVQWYSKYSG